MKILAFSLAFVSPMSIFKTLLTSSTLRRVRRTEKDKKDINSIRRKFQPKLSCNMNEPRTNFYLRHNLMISKQTFGNDTNQSKQHV
jgi:hypothetical protein